MSNKPHYSRMSSKGQITLTKPIREKIGLKEGDFVIIEVTTKGIIEIRKAEIKPTV